MRAIMVSVDYSDILALTLPYNRHHFEEVWIVTSIADYDNVLRIAEPNGARVIPTDLFYDDGARFNKWRSLEYGLDVMGRHGWLCLMDADVLWPHHLPEHESWRRGPRMEDPGEAIIDCDAHWLERYTVDFGYLYTPLRRMAPWPLPTAPDPQCPRCKGLGVYPDPPLSEQQEKANKGEWLVSPSTHCFRSASCQCNTPAIPPEEEWRRYPIHRNTKEWAGYSQIFHADDPALGTPPWHSIDWTHAGGADSAFQHRWTENRKVRPPWECLHLGNAGENWFGRTSAYADGTLPPHAESRRASMTNVWASRRGRSGAAKFATEKIQLDDEESRPPNLP